jgi:hypothetical protein
LHPLLFQGEGVSVVKAGVDLKGPDFLIEELFSIPTRLYSIHGRAFADVGVLYEWVRRWPERLNTNAACPRSATALEVWMAIMRAG